MPATSSRRSGKIAERERHLRPTVPPPGREHRPQEHVIRRGAQGRIDGHTKFLSRHSPAHGHGDSGHGGQATGIRGGDRTPVLPQQRRSQGDHGPAPRRDRRPARGAGDGDQRDHDQGHTGASSGRRQDHRRDRQGAARGHHRRRTSRGRSDTPAKSSVCSWLLPATRRPASTEWSASTETR